MSLGWCCCYLLPCCCCRPGSRLAGIACNPVRCCSKQHWPDATASCTILVQYSVTLCCGINTTMWYGWYSIVATYSVTVWYWCGQWCHYLHTHSHSKPFTNQLHCLGRQRSEDGTNRSIKGQNWFNIGPTDQRQPPLASSICNICPIHLPEDQK